MSLQEKLHQDMKDSMRSGDATRRDTIRYVRSAIQNEEIAARGALDDEAVIGVLSKQAAQRKESIEAFEAGNRPDLAAKEETELAIILEYLPEQMSREEIVELARRAIEEVGATGPQEMGKVMGRLMPQVKGKAEGREVSKVVSELLAGAADSG
jgi:uncharacterized protein YqeY